MRERPRPGRAPLNSLATKIILFVFLSTFATALVVSGIAIRSTHTHLSRLIERQYPAAVARAARSVEAWNAARGGPPQALRPDDVAALRALLDVERPDSGSHLLLVDAGGRALVVAPAEVGEPPDRIPRDRLAGAPGAGVQQYARADSIHVVGTAHPVGGSDWSVALQAPFDETYAAVLAVVTRVFVVDLCIVLLASFLGYVITTAVVRPIEHLSDAARSIAQGQFDSEIPEPASHDEIGLLARTFNDMMRRLRGYQSEIESANRSLMERNDELQQAKETFEQLSITDGLTKLHNHRFFQDHLTREIKRVTRTGEALSMLLVDIDDFKALNDRFGHAAGDELLMGLARIMNEMVRESDLLARYGGEEFVVLASNTEMPGAYRLAEKIRTAIAETSFILDDSLRPVRITVSVGVAQFSGNRKEFFRGADSALYRAKAMGKNCVVVDAAEQVS
jgi:diguanylate cyclase (GGDEF)-like protein